MKSVERVRELGEVFTPPQMVDSMLDLLPEQLWQPHPSATFFEPAAGNGNFLVAILDRKLTAVEAAYRDGALKAGDGLDALELHGLEALSAIYAVDISPENVLGNAAAGEPGARRRLRETFRAWFERVSGRGLTSRSVLLACAGWILDRNVLVANMLTFDADGRPTNRDDLPLVEYRWFPSEGRVEVTGTTLGDVESEARIRGDGPMTLFDQADAPRTSWGGAVRDLRDAPICAPSAFAGPERNGKRAR